MLELRPKRFFPFLPVALTAIPIERPGFPVGDLVSICEGPVARGAFVAVVKIKRHLLERRNFLCIGVFKQTFLTQVLDELLFFFSGLIGNFRRRDVEADNPLRPHHPKGEAMGDARGLK